VKTRAVFLDKDGTLIEDVPYNVDPTHIRLLPGVAEGLQTLHQAGFRLIVVSNQAGVARGYFEEEALEAMIKRLRQMLAASNVPLAGFYYCPHHPEGKVSRYAMVCDCRKPAPGLILRAAEEHDIDLKQSWFVGDILNDIEAGQRAGCRTILIGNGHGTGWLQPLLPQPHYVVADMVAAAARIILG
jgi:D-glycero-D-manno-heptose 1,7-bisphosphate phosphatase